MLRTSLLTLAFALFLTPVPLTDDFPDYPLNAPSEFAINSTKGDVSTGLQPIEDIKEQKTYFKTEIARLGFLPVIVVIHNGSNEDSFLFDKSGVKYGSAESGVGTPKAGSKAVEALGFSTIPFVGLFPALKAVKNASQIQQNLLKKELQSTTLSPGASAHGFLYIPVPKDGPRQRIRLLVPLSKPGADQQIVFEFVF